MSEKSASPPEGENVSPKAQPAEVPPPEAAPPRKPRRIFGKIVLVLFLLAILGGFWVWRVAVSYPDRPGAGEGKEIVFTLPTGKGPREYAKLLADAGVITQDEVENFARFLGCVDRWISLGCSGRFHELKAGEHILKDNMTPRQIVDALTRPPQALQVSVTIPEGKSIREMAPLFEAAGVCSAADFIKAAKDPELARQAGLPQKDFEGFLFPDTYRFKPGTDAKEVVLKMKKRFDEVFAEVKAKYSEGASALERDLKFSDRDIVILSSIVEKETGAEAERGFIASVFLNRLKDPNFQPKFLATDPTIIYGLAESPEGFDGDIKKKHLTDPTNPYNTYVHPGLPPGPISNFGRAALEAVLNAPPTRCYFFVAKGNGTSFFSEKEDLHRKAVDIFQRRMSKAGAESLKSAPDCTKEPPTY